MNKREKEMYKNAIIRQFQCIFLLVLLCGCSSNSQSLENDNLTTSMTTTNTSMGSSVTTTEVITEESNKGIWGDVVGFDEIDGEYYFDGLPVTILDIVEPAYSSYILPFDDELTEKYVKMSEIVPSLDNDYEMNSNHICWADETEDYIYYVNFNDSCDIYRYDKHSYQNEFFVSTGAGHSSLFIIDEYLYFKARRESPDKLSLYRVKLDGTGLKLINEAAYGAIYHDTEYLYYNEGKEENRIIRQSLSDLSISYLDLHNSIAGYSRNGNLLFMTTYNSDAVFIWNMDTNEYYVIKGHTSDHIATYKDKTYVMFDNYLYSIDQEFNIERVINIKDRIQDFLIDDDVIYFIGYRPNSKYNPGIFSMDMNTQQISYLYQLDKKNGDIILINDCIWFVNNLAGYESSIEIITKDGRIVEL